MPPADRMAKMFREESYAYVDPAEPTPKPKEASEAESAEWLTPCEEGSDNAVGECINPYVYGQNVAVPKPRPKRKCKPAGCRIKVFTIGWQACKAKEYDDFKRLCHEGANCVHQKAKALSADIHDNIMWFDCRDLSNPELTKRNVGHIGEHYQILQSVIQGGKLQALFKDVKRYTNIYIYIYYIYIST